jgi:hypothetical protein
MTSLFRWNLILGLGVIILAGILLFYDVPFMKTWFYIFAWWPLIIILDSVNFRMRGSSPLSRSPRNFLFAAFISIPVWLVFELFNLRLQNWNYHSLPAEIPFRWLGYSLAFASVIPALLELSTLFQTLLSGKKLPFLPLKTSAIALNGSILLGFLFLVLCVMFPQLFFPFVWLGFIFLLEPVNFRLGLDSLLADAKEKNGNRILSWLLAGFTAGILWEALNYWAGSHWEYTIPYLNLWRIFHMPVFGYGGFLPFAIEVFAMFTLLDFVRSRMRAKRAPITAAVVLILAFNAVSFYLIDAHTLVR